MTSIAVRVLPFRMHTAVRPDRAPHGRVTVNHPASAQVSPPLSQPEMVRLIVFPLSVPVNVPLPRKAVATVKDPASCPVGVKVPVAVNMPLP